MEPKNFAKIRFKDRLLYLKELFSTDSAALFFYPQLSRTEKNHYKFKFRFIQFMFRKYRNKALEATLSLKIIYICKDFRLNQAKILTSFNFAKLIIKVRAIYNTWRQKFAFKKFVKWSWDLKILKRRII